MRCLWWLPDHEMRLGFSILLSTSGIKSSYSCHCVGHAGILPRTRDTVSEEMNSQVSA